METKFNINEEVEWHGCRYEVAEILIKESGVSYLLSNGKQVKESSLTKLEQGIYVVVAKGNGENLVWETYVEEATKENAIKWASTYGTKYETRIARLVFEEE